VNKNEFMEFVTEQMSALGGVTARAMFGGYGLYCDGLFIAIVTGDKLYFKADALTQPDFEARGLRRFGYEARGKAVHLRYYEAPAEVFDDGQAMREWGLKALGAAVRARRPAKADTPARGS